MSVLAPFGETEGWKCDARTGQPDCYNALLSLGRACKLCPVPCYRQGWGSRQVREDIARRQIEAPLRLRPFGSL